MDSNQNTNARKIRPISMHLYLSALSCMNNPNFHDDMKEVIGGIQKYYRSDIQANKRESQRIWASKNADIVRYTSDVERYAAKVLLVPSLINSSDIFDLCDECSFAGWLINQGYDVYVLNWRVDKSDVALDAARLICENLLPAFDVVKGHLGDNLNLFCLGYCMGGTLSLKAAIKENSSLSGLILLSSPWDFHAGKALLHSRIKSWGGGALQHVHKNGFLSDEALHVLFASVDPEATRKKFSKFYNMNEADKNAAIFTFVEDWLHSGKEIPKKFALEIIGKWYLENSLHSNFKDSLRNLKTPVLVTASKRDRLVDFESSHALVNDIPKCFTVEAGCGHIGMIAGKNSVEQVWRPISNWILKTNS